MATLIIKLIIFPSLIHGHNKYQKYDDKQTQKSYNYDNYDRPWREIEYGSNGGGYIEGHVTHGINNFNGERIVDLSYTNNGFGWIWDEPLYEQQVLNEFENIAILPRYNTNRNLPLAMGRAFTVAMNEIAETPATPNPSLYNKPYYDVGTVIQTSLNIDERVVPTEFDEVTNISPHPSLVIGNTYFPRTVNSRPTLDDWEQGSGLIEVDCNDGVAFISVSVCNLLPEAVYTVWEVGVANPGYDEENYWFPAGGIGNVIRTDINGNGELLFNMPWCPIRHCIPDESIDCQIYFSVFHHSDYIVWGGDFGGVFWKPYSYPAGIIGSNHLWFPLWGEPLQDPINRWNNGAQCKRGNEMFQSYKQRKYF